MPISCTQTHEWSNSGYVCVHMERCQPCLPQQQQQQQNILSTLPLLYRLLLDIILTMTSSLYYHFPTLSTVFITSQVLKSLEINCCVLTNLLSHDKTASSIRWWNHTIWLKALPYWHSLEWKVSQISNPINQNYIVSWKAYRMCGFLNKTRTYQNWLEACKTPAITFWNPL